MLQEKLFQIDSFSEIKEFKMNEYFIADLFREIQKKVDRGMES